MHYADRALGARGGVGGGGSGGGSGGRGGGMRWYWRGIFVVHKRLLMVGQLVAVGIIVASLGAIIFDQPIPGPDYSMLERGWIPPQTGP